MPLARRRLGSSSAGRALASRGRRDRPCGFWENGILREARALCRRLYHGRDATALRFQRAAIAVDLAIIAFFAASPLLVGDPLFYWVDYSVAALLALDLTGRALASESFGRFASNPVTLVDVFILATLLAPLWLANLGFLRVLRLWTLSKTDLVWAPLRRRGLEDWQEPARAIVNLVTFLFVVTGFVYTSFHGVEGVAGYVDALYFTVATVTTTGFGDVTLPGTAGKLTSIVVMIVGISLFVRLAQAIFRPTKVRYRCPNCALLRHDPDAVHCKACGEPLKIPDADE